MTDKKMDNEKYIASAVAEFEKILREQLARNDRMKNAPSTVSCDQLGKVIIGCCGGDGIGPMITAEARRVLEKLLSDEIARGRAELRDINGLTLENRLAAGKAIPDDVLAAIRECHVILKGPTNTPQGGTGAKELESANVAMRRELDLFANVRPVSIPKEGIDWTFFRENTEGEYVLGSRGVSIPGELSCDFKVTTAEGTARIARAAFEYARKNNKSRVLCVTKANILKKTDGDFSRIAHRISEEEYPELTVEDRYIDILTAELLDTEVRSGFEVFLLPNLYGDIITDEAAQIQGGVGTAGSANIGTRWAMFEAVHGSAPRMIERGEGEFANPASMLRAAEMLLRHIGYADRADRLRRALDAATSEGSPLRMTGHRGGSTCRDMGDLIIDLLDRL